MKLVVIYGPPAVGKYTTGLALAKQTGFKLFHNHLTVDDADALFPEKSPQRRELLQQLRLDGITIAAKYDVDLIYTQAYAGSIDEPFMKLIAGTVENYGGTAYFVQLTAPEEVLRERVYDESRKHIFGKMTTEESLRRHLAARDEALSIRFAPNLLIDNSHMPADETASEIKNHYKL